jgi:hypothetical protein
MDDGQDEFDAEFAMQYPHPFTQHWYNGQEGDTRLHAARDEKQQTQAQGAGGTSGAGGAGAVQPRRIVQEGAEDSEGQTPIQRSKVWEMVSILEEGQESRPVKGIAKLGRYKKIMCILGPGGVCKNKWKLTLWGGSTGAIHKHIASVSDAHHQNAFKIL